MAVDQLGARGVEAAVPRQRTGGRPSGGLPWLEPLLRYLLGPLAGTAALALAYDEPDLGAALAVLVLACLTLGTLVARRRVPVAALLPLVRVLYAGVGPLLGVCVVQTILLLTESPTLGGVEVALTVAATWAAISLPSSIHGQIAHGRPARVAVIGPAAVADQMSRQLAEEGVSGFEVVGWIGAEDGEPGPGGSPRPAGRLGALRDAVIRHDIDLFVLTDHTPRLPVLEELSAACADLPVRLLHFSAFYERAFGQVPVAQLNSAWFQYVLHPNYRVRISAGKRCLDVVLSLAVGLFALPVIGVLALLVRRDGGPSIYRQERIGEQGRPFTLYKLRSMRVAAGESAQWSSADDTRVTAVGRLMRKTHLDELPQLLNVLRGDMSLVGPRPEQPEFVDRLEGSLRFYQRRHLARPGITGWAQVRCGYAGSDTGSALKLCHDLYYLKHRSVALDLMILSETLRTLVADRQYGLEPAAAAAILERD